MPVLKDADLRIFSLSLQQTRGLGAKTALALLGQVGGIFELYRLWKSGTGPAILSKVRLAAGKDLSDLLEQRHVRFVAIWEDDYPRLLKQIADPPFILFYVGDLEVFTSTPALAVVGTRKCSAAALQWTEKLVSESVAAGVNIVSGMAMGIDAAAHKACVAAGGKTLAVLASSPDMPTPAANSALYQQILGNGGCIVSEFPPGTVVRPGMFASRNRIVAGLSQGVLVVEAGAESGALITANLALDYNREVFALPGDIGRDVSFGCNKLIKDGKAKLVQGAVDILVELGVETVARAESYAPAKSASIDPEKLPNDQRDVFVTLSEGAGFPEELAIKVDRSVNDILSCLAVMELSGIVRQLADGKFAIA
ncbi:DNA-processing protein DprA [Candidatus Dojkabacteria bacterium]|uniref:DNA-processing protein DprA n=1 Tax=Candidatus Dojkabacteria bacterium TaxID=2099670 RepID=A0A955I6R5_9BACT|nr:DNA-processing protein DprA [Candidatus Dojkabacteria bacterium]